MSVLPENIENQVSFWMGSESYKIIYSLDEYPVYVVTVLQKGCLYFLRLWVAPPDRVELSQDKMLGFNEIVESR